ncbi:Aminotransferase [Penicillium oxalicum]|uniref:Aminotransferase n=1 Tax=Penicillium oxalicum TaxID=69781 RepID=UPI0020B6B6F0|nr:Aminotransferase [Penicillium oxalicum]KAI2787700.1 Aminotransferase [Penicillium oxalicum]
MGDYRPDGSEALGAHVPIGTTGNELGSSSRQSSVLYHHLRQPPLNIVGGRGSWLITDSGQEILDATCGAAVACLGHSDKRVHDAIMEQLQKFPYCYSMFFTNNAAEELSKILVDSTEGVMSRAYVVSSGTEAVEASLKMAVQYFMEMSPKQPQRVNFIARKQSYHGNTLGSLSVGHHLGRRALYEKILAKNVHHVSQCYPYREMRDEESMDTYVARLAQELEDKFQELGPDTVCAFVAETVTGATLGCVPALPGYLKAMKEVCQKHGALLILDEVMCGMGRTGTLHAWEQEDVTPDLQTVAKGLGGGYAPIAALLVNRRVVDTLSQGSGAFSHSQTYQGHPVSCAAACKVQKIIRDDHLLANVREMGEYLGQLLHETFDKYAHVGDIRGRGLFWAIEFVLDKETKQAYPPSQAVAWTIHKTAL